MMKITYLCLGVSLALIPVAALGQCVATQDCATLGYTESSCAGGSGVKCPFGNKWACFQTEAEICSKYGFTQTCNGVGQIGSGGSCAGLYQQCSCQDTYKYTCTGTGYAGGSGTACSEKYTACVCSDRYEWVDGVCQPLDGIIGDWYYCKGQVVGIRAEGMNFFVATVDASDDYVYWGAADILSKEAFCGKGRLPDNNELKLMYKNKSAINAMSIAAGGESLKDIWYWSSSSCGSGSYCRLNMGDGDLINGGYYTGGIYVRSVLAP